MRAIFRHAPARSSPPVSTQSAAYVDGEVRACRYGHLDRAWGKDALDPWIRIDFVQHKISALIGVWYMTKGSIPVATPID